MADSLSANHFVTHRLRTDVSRLCDNCIGGYLTMEYQHETTGPLVPLAGAHYANPPGPNAYYQNVPHPGTQYANAPGLGTQQQNPFVADRAPGPGTHHQNPYVTGRASHPNAPIATAARQPDAPMARPASVNVPETTSMCQFPITVSH